MDTWRDSPRNYDVQVGDVVWKRHEEQLRPRYIPTTQYTESKQSELNNPNETYFSLYFVKRSLISTQEHKAHVSEEAELEAR